MKYIKVFLVALFLISNGSIMAHPGHGLETNSFWHYLLSPVHLVIIIVTSALIYLVVKVKPFKSRKDA